MAATLRNEASTDRNTQNPKSAHTWRAAASTSGEGKQFGDRGREVAAEFVPLISFETDGGQCGGGSEGCRPLGHRRRRSPKGEEGQWRGNRQRPPSSCWHWPRPRSTSVMSSPGHFSIPSS